MIETKRLILRKMKNTDFKFMKTIWQNEKCMKYYPKKFNDNDLYQLMEKNIMRYQYNGLGHYIIILKATGMPIGQAGFSRQPYKGKKVLEIGYLLNDQYWHYGYASEIVKSLLEYGKDYWPNEKIYSTIVNDNESSKRVATTAGAKLVDEYDEVLFDQELNMCLYEYVI